MHSALSRPSKILCMNPRQGKYINISLPPHLEDKLVVGMTVTSDNDLFILIDESANYQLSVLEYNQAWKEWENTGMSPVRKFIAQDWGMEEFFVEIEEHLYFITVKDIVRENIILVETRRYNRDAEEWQECSQLRIVEEGRVMFCVVVPCSSHLYFLMNSEVHRYDPVHDQWDARTPPRTIPHLSTAVAMGTEIFCTDDNFTKIMVYNTVSDSWEALQAWLNPRNLVVSYHPYLFVLENQLHVLLEPVTLSEGDLEEEDCLVLVYHRSEDAWRDLKATLPPVECYTVCCPMCTMARMHNGPTMS